jgi:hypothetical protein
MFAANSVLLVRIYVILLVSPTPNIRIIELYIILNMGCNFHCIFTEAVWVRGSG